MATVKIFDLWVVEASSSVIIKIGCVPNYTMERGAVSRQPEGVRRPAVARIAATIMDEGMQQTARPQGAIRKGHHPRTADDV